MAAVCLGLNVLKDAFISSQQNLKLDISKYSHTDF